MRHFLFGFLFFLVISTVSATEVLGPTYPVIEIDLLEVLKTYVAESKENPKFSPEKTFKALLNLDTNEAFPETKIAKQWFIERQQGGEEFRRLWLFINAKDAKQLSFTKTFLAEHPKSRVILSQGNYQDASHALRTHVWLDRSHQLARQLHISALPSLVIFDNRGALVQEINLDEEAHRR